MNRAFLGAVGLAACLGVVACGSAERKSATTLAIARSSL